METIRTIRERNLLEIGQVTQCVDIYDAIILQRISHRLHQLDENACNYGLTPRQEKRVERLEEQAQAIAQKFHLTAYHQSDPRGWSLYLTPPNTSQYTDGLAICPH